MRACRHAGRARSARSLRAGAAPCLAVVATARPDWGTTRRDGGDLPATADAACPARLRPAAAVNAPRMPPTRSAARSPGCARQPAGGDPGAAERLAQSRAPRGGGGRQRPRERGLAGDRRPVHAARVDGAAGASLRLRWARPRLRGRAAGDDPAQLDGSVPAALLPVRLETRFAKGAAGRSCWCGSTRTRSTPTATSPSLTADERAAGAPTGRRSSASPAAELDRGAWRGLAQRFGPGRAAWIARALTPISPRAQAGARGRVSRRSARAAPWTRAARARRFPTAGSCSATWAAGASSPRRARSSRTRSRSGRRPPAPPVWRRQGLARPRRRVAVGLRRRAGGGYGPACPDHRRAGGAASSGSCVLGVKSTIAAPEGADAARPHSRRTTTRAG